MEMWPASGEVLELVEKVKQQYHLPRLVEARITVSFEDSKPFINGRFNWGKVSKFPKVAKIRQPADKRIDFSVILSADAWVSVLNASQREAWLDLCLERCQVKYKPVTVEENGKKHTVRDEWGRVQYTDTVITDNDGIPVWQIAPLDIHVLQANVIRYGCWCVDLLAFRDSVIGRDK